MENDKQKNFEIDIVRTIEELKGALDLRRKEFVIKQQVEENTEFDGNDYTSTHIIAKQNGKVVATMRLRYFNHFVRMERFCKDRDTELPGITREILKFTTKFLEDKGYHRTHCFCEEPLVKHWLKMNHELLEGASNTQVGHMKLFPVSLILKKQADHVTISSHPDVLIAQEGKWKLGPNNHTKIFQSKDNFEQQTQKKSRKQLALGEVENTYEIDLVRTLPEFESVLALRHHEFVDKQGVSNDTEFDGNDFTATHIIAKQNGETVATMRLRYFNHFVRMERFCKDRDKNIPGVTRQMLAFTAKFLEDKGYHRTHCFCEEPLVRHWLTMNHVILEGAEEVKLDKMKLYPVSLVLRPDAPHISIMSRPENLIAAEGRWNLDEDSPVKTAAQENAVETKQPDAAPEPEHQFIYTPGKLFNRAFIIRKPPMKAPNKRDSGKSGR